MKISFLVTYYNQEKCVRDSLDSILRLNLNIDYEILVGDDGSTDQTPAIINEYISRFPDKIHLYTMPREQDRKYNPIHRASANRINLVLHATGDYLCFLDGDDYYVNQDFAQEGVDILEKNRELVGCAFNFVYIYPGNKKVTSACILQDGLQSVKNYILRTFVHVGGFVFRNIFDSEKIKTVTASQNFDDNLITIFLLQYGSFYFINKPAYGYVQYPNSIWNMTTLFEKNVLTALDYDIIGGVAPSFKPFLFERQFGGIKSVYLHRKNMEKLLGPEKYQKYLLENERLSKGKICSILKWRTLSTAERWKIKVWFWKNTVIHSPRIIFSLVYSKLMQRKNRHCM